MARAKKKYRARRRAEREENRVIAKRDYLTMVIEKMRREYSIYAYMEDYRRGRLL